MNGTIYISGPITGTPDYVERFMTAEKHLREEGWENIINPVVITSEFPEDTPWEQYMRKCIQVLMGADAIYMLKGWVYSRGAKFERYIACMLGIYIEYEPNNEVQF